MEIATAIAIATAFVNLAKEMPSIIAILRAEGESNEELIAKIREAQAGLPVWT